MLAKARLLDEIIKTTMSDNVKIRSVEPDGYHHKIAPVGEPLRSQKRFMEIARDSKPKQVEALLPEPRLPLFATAATAAAAIASAPAPVTPALVIAPTKAAV